jgi:hypothetical protein
VRKAAAADVHNLPLIMIAWHYYFFYFHWDGLQYLFREHLLFT